MYPMFLSSKFIRKNTPEAIEVVRRSALSLEFIIMLGKKIIGFVELGMVTEL
ncbi:MAG: hypothetical protein ACI92E_002557 [Oceanicoccus sp.]|jgi:hypothetical protein